MDSRKTLRELCDALEVTRRAVQGYEKAGLVAGLPCIMRSYVGIVNEQDGYAEVAFINNIETSKLVFAIHVCVNSVKNKATGDFSEVIHTAELSAEKILKMILLRCRILPIKLKSHQMVLTLN